LRAWCVTSATYALTFAICYTLHQCLGGYGQGDCMGINGYHWLYLLPCLRQRLLASLAFFRTSSFLFVLVSGQNGNGCMFFASWRARF
jgi:uncharacterized membrane protein YhdT